jgi:hypothetical protein
MNRRQFQLYPFMYAWRISRFCGFLLAAGVLRAQSAPDASAPSSPLTVTPVPAKPAAPALPDNVTLSVKGQIGGMDLPIDLSWDGTGPKFSISTTQPNPDDQEHPYHLDFKGTISVTEGAYLVKYSLFWQVPRVVETGGANGAPNKVSYLSFGLGSSVIIKLDQPAILMNEQGKTLTLTLTKSAKSNPVTPAS